MTVFTKGARRYLLDLRVATAATTRQRAQVNAVVRSFETRS